MLLNGRWVGEDGGLAVGKFAEEAPVDGEGLGADLGWGGHCGLFGEYVFVVVLKRSLTEV